MTRMLSPSFIRRQLSQTVQRHPIQTAEDGQESVPYSLIILNNRKFFFINYVLTQAEESNQFHRLNS